MTITPTTQPTETTTTTPGTCTAEEFVEAFMVTGLQPLPGRLHTKLPCGKRGACAIGALTLHWTGERYLPVELDDFFQNGVTAGFDGHALYTLLDPDNPLYQQGYAVGRKVRELMGVTDG